MRGIDLDSFATTLHADDPVVRDHRVHGVRILPGVVYLDMILRAAMAAGYQPGDLTIREALFQRPVALADDGAVRIAFRVDRPTGRIAIDVQRLDHAGAPYGPVDSVAECVVVRSSSPTEPPASDTAVGSAQARGMAEMYAQSGSRGIEHRDFMRATGHFARSGDIVTATMGLGPEAAAHLPGFLLHPTFLDASTIVPFVDPQRLGADDDSAFIPIYFGDVHAWQATPEQVFVRASVRGGGHGGDLLEADVALYAPDGSPVVRYRLTSKRVRGSADIHRLLTPTEAPAPQQPVPASSTVMQYDPAATGPVSAAQYGPPAASPAQGPSTKDPRALITADLAALVAAELGADAAGIATDVGFYELGLDSGRLLRLTAELEGRVGEPLYPTLLFEYQTIDALAGHLAETVGANYRPDAATTAHQPGAGTTPAEFATQSTGLSRAPQVAAPPSGSTDPGPAPHAATPPGSNALGSTPQAVTPASGSTDLGPAPYAATPTTGSTGQGPAPQAVTLTTGSTDPAPAPQAAVPTTPSTGSVPQAAAPKAGSTEFRSAQSDAPIADPPFASSTTVAPASAARDELVTFGFDWETDATAHPRREAIGLLVFDTADHPYRHAGAAAVVRVRPGDEFVSGAVDFAVNPTDPRHMGLLVEQLTARGLRFDAVLYLWPESIGDDDSRDLIERVYLPLRDLVRATAGLSESPVRLLLAVTRATPAGELSCALLGGFARTLRLEQPQPILRAVQCDPGAAIDDIVAAELGVEERHPATEIRYRGGRREIRSPRLDTDSAGATGDPVLRRGSVVVVTGGFGGIARHLARRLATDYSARLVLVSRRPLDAAGAGLLAELNDLGAEAVHVRADVSVAADAERVAAIAHATFGPVDVLYHGAGQLRDGLVSGSGGDEAISVLAPKVHGVRHLTRALPEARLTVLFSSVSAVLGNPGQADYAAANRYLDVFAEQRDQAGTRTVSVNWPLWAEGGMHPPAEQIAALRRAGIGLLPTATGLDLLLSCAALDRAQLAAVWGDPEVVRARLRPAASQARAAVESVTADEHPAPARPVGVEEPIAIVGVSGRYPDADDLDEFWRNLRDGHDAVGPVPAERWWLTAARDTPGAPPMTGGFLRDVGGFDPQFFRIPPVQAPLLDPQERLFLQQAYAALEHAGYHHTDPSVRDRRVGVFVGATWSDYRLLGVEASRDGDPVAVASIPSSIANRTSYTLGLRGPSLTVDTACSASLTALHLARRAMLDGECDAAIVGGVNLLLHEDKFLLLSSLGMMSGSGRCRPFAASADGYVPGEGVGALYLKPLSAARADGDTIHGLILGSAVNHGGQTSGYSVPHPGAQADVITEALRAAGVDPAAIDYLEAHGTGTPLGDPIEIAGLAAAFGRSDGTGRSRALGSTKSNIGHLEAAAGVAGLTRVLLQMRHGRIAPTLHAAQVNPAIAFDSVPFHLPRELEEWPRRTVDGVTVPRYAGVSAFGAGGANAHVVLAEFVDDRTRSRMPVAPEIFVLSARTAAQLRRYAEIMARHFRTLNPAHFTDSVRTLQVGRPALAHRMAVVASSPVAVADALDQFLTGQPGPVLTGTADAQTRPQFGPPASDQDLARHWVAGADIDWRDRGGPERRVALPGYPFDRTDYWILTPPQSTFDAAVAQFEAATRSAGVVEPGKPELGRYAAMLLFATLAGMGLTPGEWTVESLDAALGVRPEFARLRTSCLDILLRHGLLCSQQDTIVVPGPPPGTSGMRADLLARFPETKAYVTLLDACLAAYPRVLRGELSATEVLFPGGDLELVGAIYRGNAAYDFTNGLLAELVSALARQRGTARPLRILEIGAGTGGSTHAVLAALTEHGTAYEYHYTDVSHSFVAHGRRTFGTNPNLRFTVLDIETDPVAQGFAAGDADLVVCANVLHATRSIDSTLRNARRLLAPGGVLAFTEATTDLEVLALTFGLLEGWHAYRDPAARIPHSPLLSEQQWRDALSAAGFSGIRAWGPGLSEDPEPSFRLLAAVSAAAPADSRSEPAVFPEPARADAVGASAQFADNPAGSVGRLDSEPARTGAASAPASSAAASALEAELIGLVADGLGVAHSEVRAELPLSEYGVDSILAVKIIDRVNARYGLALRPTVVFDHPSVRLLSRRMAEDGATATGTPPTQPTDSAPSRMSSASHPSASSARSVGAPTAQRPPTGRPSERSASMDIAIIGMSGKFPGAADLAEFWRNLAAGHDSVTEVPASRWPVADYFRPGPVTPGKTYSKWGGFLDDVEQFDPAFFDLVPAEADYMDPQQRLFLEHSWLALEDAAIDPKSLRRKRCGVFAGSPGSDYATLLRNRGTVGSHHMFTGNSPAILPARVAYQLDLTGPCLGLDTACSSALVALHQACRSLASGESELALAGGVAVFVTPEYHLLASSMGMLSPQGRCASFDAEADGFVIAEGVGVVVLKPLAAAERDGDPIHGVIRGIGVNHDGRTNGITAPSVRSQTELELAVYREGGIDPSTIGYVETHGTGTRLGDPIEIEALAAAFRHYTDAVAAIPVGSVKSNIGHASHAAGMASLFKVLLAMRAGQLPPSLHVASVNPLLGLDESPFFVNTALREWSGPRRAAISSFGFSGTNAHVVVDAAPSADAARPRVPGGPQLIVLSARSATSLTRMARTLRRHLAANPDLVPADIARTLAQGRSGFEHRLAIVADSVDGIAARLAAFAEGDRPAGVFTGVTDSVTDSSGSTVLDDPVAAARRWVEGAHVEYAGWSDPAARRIHLPGYEFDRERCWVPEESGVPSFTQATDLPPGSSTPQRVVAASPMPSQVAGVAESVSNPATLADRVVTTSDGGATPPDAESGRPMPAAPHTEAASTAPLWRSAETYLKGLLAEYCRLAPERIRTRIPLQDYGIDSVLISKMNDRLETDFGPLPSTLFFEYQTVRDLAGYLADEHAPRLAALTSAPTPAAAFNSAPAPTHAMADSAHVDVAHGASNPARTVTADPATAASHSAPVSAHMMAAEPASGAASHNAPHLTRAVVSRPADTDVSHGEPDSARAVTADRVGLDSTPAAASASVQRPTADDSDDIAVIGMAGRFPMAGDIEEFWANLVAGRDCIVEVPPQRWDHREYLSDDPDEPGTTYARWGGFIDDVDKFDARFFGITPKDAEEMDPQQRLFLETSWAALEDAGYTPDRVRASAASRGLLDAGVFAGVGYAEYQAFVGVPISGYFAVANRVSYHFGFSGPSLAVDTACSASLTALHLACESLRRGESAYALAGGVNVSIHPGKYLLLGYGRWASTDGRCRSFGAGGDGYVPGEGVVTLVLKPLRHARADGDRVYGVIRGSAINHGGRTNGFTVPNPAAQADLIGRALTAAHVDAGDIGYVEAHGTGTALGDPIEIAALTKAYRRSTTERGYCGIGSAKSSVGHLEAAAGAAGVVKALLQLRHDTIAPNLHSDPPNPGIDFAATPFRIIDQPTAWPRPDDGRPRITAVSSFGAGGSNAHVILADAEPIASTPEDGQPRIVVLSARDADRLTELATRVARRLREHPVPLPDVAWTLAVGRTAFQHRLAVVAASTAELVELLYSAAASGTPAPAEGMLIFRGVARTHREVDELPGESDADRAEIRALLRSGNLPRVAELWAGGWTVDWAQSYERPFGRIVSLPGYPFARRRYWIVPEDYRRRSQPVAPQLVAKTVVAHETDAHETGRRNGHSTNGNAAQEVLRSDPAAPELVESDTATTPSAITEPAAGITEPGITEAATGVTEPAGATEPAGITAPRPVAAEPVGDGFDTALRDQLSAQIRDIFADLTKTDPAELDLDAEFADFGFDSVATVRMLNRLMKHYDVKIPAESTELYPTIASLSEYLVTEGIITGEAQAEAPRATETAAAETQQHIPPVTMDAPIPVRSVFITGVTGVLGGKLLHDLLADSDVRVTCLVRGKTVDAAERRIKHFLATYDPDGTLDQAFADRVTTVLGDVSSERLGLDEATWHRLADEVDLTIHAAGRTTLVTFYDALAPINVEGTRRAVEFALRSRGKYLVYVSSFSALGDRLNFNNPPFTERDLELGQGYDHLPYQQTKYESEKLIRAASERGLLWDIVRPGNIMGDSRTGRYPFSEVSVKGAYYDILKTMIETGETMLTPVHWDITPVDYVSAAIVHIALHRPTYRETYHLTNPDIRRYYDVVRYVQRAGYEVSLVPLEEFHRRATDRQIYRLGTDEVYDSQTLEMFKYGIELFGTIHYEESSYADCAYTRRVLGAAGIDCPPTEDLVRVYLAHCAEVGYLPAPRAAESTAEVLR
ncbi:thioester reductase domain-containing protein [Nocardia pneumoniae]|uniref:thioester reductase domain-containing protein n=1 Tax=Nocardia pneumoniae TaxID=228601 RepID=UPI000310F377|nr:thioester reductase domain-containing protein [Nocardia pneumoniae]